MRTRTKPCGGLVPVEFDPLMNLPRLDFPAELGCQPADQLPGLDDGVRAMFDEQFGRGGDGPGRGGFLEGLLEQAPPVFQASPVQVGSDAPAAAAHALLELLQPGIRRRHRARRLDPAEAVVDDLLSVFRQFVKQWPR